MKVRGQQHVYRFVPNYLNNRQLPPGEQVVIRMRNLTIPEDDSLQREIMLNQRKFSPDKAQELKEKRFVDKMREKFDGVEGLEIEDPTGLDLDDFDIFYAHAPREIVNAFIVALRSTETLAEGEEKNFLPESGTRSGSPATRKR